jgi:hypothetical protein
MKLIDGLVSGLWDDCSRNAASNINRKKTKTRVNNFQFRKLNLNELLGNKKGRSFRIALKFSLLRWSHEAPETHQRMRLKRIMEF